MISGSLKALYKKNVTYIKKNPKHFYDKVMKDELALAPTPQSHFVLRLFVRKFRIPVVAVYIQPAEDDPNNNSTSCILTFYVYKVDKQDPVVEVSPDGHFPKKLLRQYNVFITLQESIMLCDTDNSRVEFVQDCYHHKILATYYSPVDSSASEASSGQENDESSKSSADEGKKDDDKKDDDDNDEVLSIERARKKNPVLKPGHLIQFYYPGMGVGRKEWLRRAIVLSTKAGDSNGPMEVETTFNVKIPMYQGVKILGEIVKKNSKIVRKNLDYPKLIELQRYRVKDKSLSDKWKKRCQDFKLNNDDMASIEEHERQLERNVENLEKEFYPGRRNTEESDSGSSEREWQESSIADDGKLSGAAPDNENLDDQGVNAAIRDTSQNMPTFVADAPAAASLPSNNRAGGEEEEQTGGSPTTKKHHSSAFPTEGSPIPKKARRTITSESGKQPGLLSLLVDKVSPKPKGVEGEPDSVNPRSVRFSNEVEVAEVAEDGEIVNDVRRNMLNDQEFRQQEMMAEQAAAAVGGVDARNDRAQAAQVNEQNRRREGGGQNAIEYRRRQVSAPTAGSLIVNRPWSHVEESFVVNGLSPPLFSFPPELFQRGVVSHSISFNNKFNWRNWLHHRFRSDHQTWAYYKQFCMSNKELMKLLMSPIVHINVRHDHSQTSQIDMLAEKGMLAYSAVRETTLRASRDLDPTPALDKLSFDILQRAFRRDEMRRDFGAAFCNRTEGFFPGLLQREVAADSAVLCYFIKIDINVEHVNADVVREYFGSNDRQITNEVQRVTLRRPGDLARAEIAMYDRVMDELLFVGLNNDLFGPFCTWIMVVPGRYFHVRYAKYDDGNYKKLPVKWLERHQHHHDHDMRNGGFVREYSRSNIFTYEKRINNAYSDSSPVVCTSRSFSNPNCSNISFAADEILESMYDLPLNACGGYRILIKDNPSSRQQRSGLEHRVNKYAFGSISDESLICEKVEPIAEKKSKVDSEMEDVADIREEGNGHNAAVTSNTSTTMGKRKFWNCTHLGGPMTYFTSRDPIKVEDVEDYLIVQCDNMQQMPYRGQGCCFMLSDGLIWICCVVHSFTKETLQYQKFKERNTTLDAEIFEIKVSSLVRSHVFHFVNLFHSDIKLMRHSLLHHCVVNKYGNVEGMLKPSVWKEVAAVSEYCSRKKLRLGKKSRARVKCRVSGKGRRSSRCRNILSRQDASWHTIYVKKNSKSACEEIVKENKLKNSFYIIVPSPLFSAEREEWICFPSGFKYCYREHFVIDVSHLKKLQKISCAIELHYNLFNLCAGSVNLIQPGDCRNTRFCIVKSSQFETLRKKEGVEMMRTEDNLYLYEHSNKASWSLPGCVVSSWETNDSLPEFTMEEVEKLVMAVGKGTSRKTTNNKGIYLTLGPRLSSRPRPNPTIQDETKLHFSDFYRQEWGCQELMYLLRRKVCHGAECIRQRSIALNPGYMRLVGHHCCARQILSSGVCKPKKCGNGDGGVEYSTVERKVNSSVKKSRENTLGYVNSLHYDMCDLVLKMLVSRFIDKFCHEIMSMKNYSISKKMKVVKKVKEIRSLVGIGLPTTCAHNIICDSKLHNVASLSSLFVMFDFAMTLGHKTVHNFFGWSFIHCTALPILIFHNGTVNISNDDAEDEHCIVMFAWGNSGGKKESMLNMNMKSNDELLEEGENRDELSTRIVERISMM